MRRSRTKVALAVRSSAALVAATSAMLVGIARAQDGPSIALDTTELVADIRQARTAAATVEEGLQEALSRLAAHTARLDEAGCEPEDQARECLDLRDSMRGDYLALLDGVEGRLPGLRDSVGGLVDNLERRMAAETGTMRDVQDELAGAPGGSAASGPALRGVSGFALSENLASLQGLVASAGAGEVSMRAVQSDLYLDMTESLQLIDAIEAEIARTRINAELQIGGMQVSEEDIALTGRVRDQLFGRRESAGVPDARRPEAPEPQDFRSPLEM